MGIVLLGSAAMVVIRVFVVDCELLLLVLSWKEETLASSSSSSKRSSESKRTTESCKDTTVRAWAWTATTALSLFLLLFALQ